jgi:hypothetical protein
MSGRTLWIVVGLVLLFVVFYVSRSDYRAFDAQREAWHRRCDDYIGKEGSDPRIADCQRELEELMAYAKRKGWAR